MITIGLTGGIGSGKTSVSDIFNSLGIPVIDTDEISRDLVNNNLHVQKEISDIFGKDVTCKDGSINRQQLASIIFNDKSARKKLENILHPKIRDLVKSEIEQLASGDTPPHYILIVVPLLFETDFRDFIDRALVITADEGTRVERIKQRDNRPIEEIQSIIASQVTDDYRVRNADDIIENNGNFGELTSQVQKLHKKFSNMHNPHI